MKDDILTEKAAATLQAEVDRAMENPHYGLRVDRMQAFIGPRTWKINPRGHVKSVRDQLSLLTDEYPVRIKQLEKAGSRVKLEQYWETVNRQIFKLGLVGFNFDEMLEDESAGPTVLGLLAEEIRAFLVEHGGAIGWQFSQTLHHINLLSRYYSGQTSGTSTSPGAGPKTASAPS